MSHRDKISILITFSVGLIAGAYLYLTGFATTFSIPDIISREAYSDLVVTADSYGSCEVSASCFAFQVIGDGSYRAIFDATGEKIVVERRIPRSLRNELKTILTSDYLVPTVEENNRFACDIDTFNETYYRFNIAIASSTYILDTCAQEGDFSPPVWQTLIRLLTRVSEFPS